MKNILITGGAGYIGSHTVVELLNKSYEVVIVDNYSNSNPDMIECIKKLTGCKPIVYEVDILDENKFEEIFMKHDFDAVIHFAGYKAVGESVEKPLMYYRNNITGTLILCELMKKYGVNKLVFSSSATVYGMNNESPLREDMELSTTNPYGSTKLMIELILKDICISNKEWSVISLRYFNPIGAHASGLIGENPNGIPNNLMPFITQVAIGKREILSIFGSDYDTHDGTGVRDYIHVVDLAVGHLKALNFSVDNIGFEAINLGTGKGYSVLDVVNSFIRESGVDIPYTITGRRSGDIASCFANATKAKDLLGWVAKKNLDDMCRDSWNWQQNNPKGYEL